MKNMLKKLLFLIVIFSFSYPAILVWEHDCEETPDNPNPPHPTVCYHQVAMSYAIINNRVKAIQYCNKIGQDTTWKYSEEAQMSRCFKDISVMLDPPDVAICNYITKNDDVKELCIEQVENEIIKNQNKDKCNIPSLIIPITILSSLFFRRFVH
ncbi:MAG: hypothetical protein PHU63_02635 [Candidatus ainarchaeum sp.]|nr:hypothetical protein [Candidatus ainarchaeum sp.]